MTALLLSLSSGAGFAAGTSQNTPSAQSSVTRDQSEARLNQMKNFAHLVGSSSLRGLLGHPIPLTLSAATWWRVVNALLLCVVRWKSHMLSRRQRHVACAVAIVIIVIVVITVWCRAAPYSRREQKGI